MIASEIYGSEKVAKLKKNVVRNFLNETKLILLI